MIEMILKRVVCVNVTDLDIRSHPSDVRGQIKQTQVRKGLHIAVQGWSGWVGKKNLHCAPVPADENAKKLG